jgi:hypothetical protein
VKAGAPAWPVDDVVVAAAEQHEVARLGCAALLPGNNVVGFAPVGRSVAARESAALVAQHGDGPQRWRDGAGGAAVVEDGGAPAAEDAVQDAVAEQPAGGDGVDGGAADGGGPADIAAAVEVEDQVDVGPVPAAVVGRLVVEEEAADVAQGIGSPGGGCPGGLALDVAGVGQPKCGE